MPQSGVSRVQQEADAAFATGEHRSKLTVV